MTANETSPIRAAGLEANSENSIAPEAIYRARAERFAASLARAQKASARLSNARLAVFVGAVALVVVLGYLGLYLFTAFALVLGITVFTVLVVRHHRLERTIIADGHLHAVNSAGLHRLAGQWKDFPDKGEEFACPKHSFADDLDLFGRASLFQWMGAAETRYGRAHLAACLKTPALDREAIVARQVMVRELAPHVEWRQTFQAAGKEVAKANEDPDALIGWAEEKGGLTFSPLAILALRIWGLVVPVSVVTFGYFIPIPVLVALPLIANGWLLSRFKRHVQPVVVTLCHQRKNLEVYQSMLGLIESADFMGTGKSAPSSTGLSSLVANLGHGKVTASHQAKELITIANWLDIRENPMVHFMLNFLLLWDMQWLSAFQGWKVRSGTQLRKWLEGIAQIEALASLSIIRFENPQWCFPTFTETGPAHFRARDLGHPLIARTNRVCNDFHLGNSLDLGGEGALANSSCGVILTGSNMTGKSTWLRTVGINLVLAYAGAPVCATTLETGLFRIHTSMRLKDDLDQGVSSFYAELLRIRGIMDAARQGLQVLFLIDEIFRGTNSVDRIAGAKEVLLQLARLGAKGLVSTHDLELGQLADSHHELFRNSHFSEHFEDGKIRFDFRLQAGISTTRNAIHLMHLAGVTDSAPG
jgi:MutS domain V